MAKTQLLILIFALLGYQNLWLIESCSVSGVCMSRLSLEKQKTQPYPNTKTR